MGQSLLSAEELPFFCRYVGGVRDEKAPGFVIDAILGSQTVCPPDQGDFEATDVDPRGYGVRVMFDELLDGDSVETLDCDEDGICVGSLATTQPVNFTCGTTNTAVDYDGYYVPNGNNTTFPLGPSLVVVPLSIDAPTGSDCTVTMGAAVKDKSGVAVEAAEASLDFRLADLAIVDTDPHDADDVGDRGVIDPDGAIAFAFNAYIDAASITAADFEIRTEAGAVVASAFAVDDFNVEGDAILIFGAADLAPGNYVARLKSGAVINEVNGGMITLTADEDVRFVVE